MLLEESLELLFHDAVWHCIALNLCSFNWIFNFGNIKKSQRSSYHAWPDIANLCTQGVGFVSVYH